MAAFNRVTIRKFETFAQESDMRNVYQVLREKEDAIAEVRREVEALRSVSPLLANASANGSYPAMPRERETLTGSELGDALRTVASLLIDDTEEMDPEVRARLVEAGEEDFRLYTTKRISHRLRHLAAPLLGANPR
jgi:hypothetical protein